MPPRDPGCPPSARSFIWAESVVSPPLLRFCVTAHSLTAVPTTGSLSFRVKAPQEPLKPWLSSLSLGPPRSALQLQSVEFRLSFMAPACCPPKSPSSSFSIWDNGIKAEEASVAPVCPACPGLWREPGRCISSSLSSGTSWDLCLQAQTQAQIQPLCVGSDPRAQHDPTSTAYPVWTHSA